MKSSPAIVILAALLTTALTLPATAFAEEELPPHMVELEAKISHNQVLIAEPQEVFATINLQALHAEVEERPPMNLALVIDRSGSMRGERILQARQAAKYLVDSLDENDRLGLVTYETGHRVEFDSMEATEVNRAKMHKIIDGIRVSGATNISDGYQAVVEIVKKHHDENAINRVLHLSDGHANRGITDPDQLRALSRQAYDNGVSTTSIGFGLNYNERLMTGMAVEGSGNYYFVNDGQDLSALVAREMTGLSATVANRIEVILDPGHGVEIVDVIGFNHRYRDGQVIVSLSEMAAGMRRNIAVRLNVVPQNMETMEILGVRANYRDAINDRHRYRQQRTYAGVTEMKSVVESNINSDVMIRVERVRMAEQVDKAMQQYSAGNQEGAAQMLAQEQARSRSVRRQYDIEEEDLEDLDRSYDRMERTVRARPARSPEAREMQMESSEELLDVIQTW